MLNRLSSTKRPLHLLIACVLLLHPACTSLDDSVKISDPPMSSNSFSEEEISFDSDTLQMGGLLFMPEGSGPFPGAVFIRGSGDSYRDSLWARSFVDAFASHGIAVLLPDKRGNGTSEGDWRTADFNDYALDTIAGVEFLAGNPRVDPARVGVIGLSQGGHVAPLAGSLSSEISFVIDISGAATTPVEQVNHEMRNTFRQAGLDEEGIMQGMELQRLAGAYVRTGDWESYESAMARALVSPIASVAEGFPQTPDSWVWNWWRGIGDFDPIEHWSSLGKPALIVYGEDDELDNVPVKESVRRLEPLRQQSWPSFEVLLYPDSGHALYSPETHEVRPELLQYLVHWIHLNTTR